MVTMLENYFDIGFAITVITAVKVKVGSTGHRCLTLLMIFVSEHTETVKKLASLHILNEQTQTGRLPGWRLNEVFRKNLKIALTGGYVVLLKFVHC